LQAAWQDVRIKKGFKVSRGQGVKVKKQGKQSVLPDSKYFVILSSVEIVQI